MKFILGLVIFFSAAFSLLPASEQVKSPVQWKLEVSRPAIGGGDEIDVIVTAQIAPHWLVYSSDFKAEIGPQPTEFSFEATDSFRLVGGIVSVNPKRKTDKTWDTEFGYFDGCAEFRQRIKVLKPEPVIVARVKGQLCNERDGTCTLFEEKLSR